MERLTIEIEVDESGEAVLQLGRRLSPGRHEVVVLINDEPASSKQPKSLDLPKHSLGTWPAGFSLRREDLYDELGR